MFINTVFFPMLKKEKDSEFRDWFVWTNQKYAKHKGFISRKLLKPTGKASYAIKVEHESLESFMAMHNSSTQVEAYERLEPLFEGELIPNFY
jgi:heme-degrading monooxygenase HmoA